MVRRAPTSGAISPLTGFSRTSSPSSARSPSPFRSVFFGIAAFLFNVVLGRLIEAQREQIASLKALGFPSLPIAVHYCQVRNARVPDRVAGACSSASATGRA